MTQPSSTRPQPSAKWAGFCGEELGFIAEYASPRSYAKGCVIISEGDEALALYVILSGELRVYTTTHCGKEIILRVLGAGDYFGELTLFDDATRSASVKATEACELLALPKGKLAECLALRPQLYAKLLRDVSFMVRRTTDDLKRVASMDVYQRVVKLLLELATRQGDDLVVAQRLTQQELANRVCASREMVSRVLQGLVAGGYITLDRRQVTIRKKLPEKW
jgi:CRP/FNR family cyclic AMP-dependent transcriptional regulator